MRRIPVWGRAALAIAVLLATALPLLSTAAGPTSPQLELAADTSLFDPGNIISDSMFWDSKAMTYDQVASFIAAKETNCKPGSDGTPCLKNYRQDTFTRPGDAMCPLTYYGASQEDAAGILWRVAQVCNISPKVLLVLLQKEQGLITDSGSSLYARRYQIATGYGCPDTAACDSQYYGFYNQLWNAAHQYRRYATYPANYSYRAGMNNTIQWSPNGACGTSTVYIQNQATAGLYVYTPYRPNSAALKAGYGQGDGCSAYGNRNFWLYFTDWFGSTQSPGGDAILAAYAARGGATGSLGASTTGIICGLRSAGCGQSYQNGTIYWSPSTGAYAVTGPYLSAWAGREGGVLGYPTSDVICGLTNGGCGQLFQGGRIYSTTATGTNALTGSVLDAWLGTGAEAGVLGYPTTGFICGLKDGGCGQVFQGGRIYTTSATGTHVLAGDVNTAWAAQGSEAGPLGYPTADLACGLKNSGCWQAFQGGRIYTSPTTGTHYLTGAIQSAWIAQGSENGTLGYPTGDQVCGLSGGGCKQSFQGGDITSAAGAGTNAIAGDLAAAWSAAGSESGALGYPTTGLICGLKNGGCGQVFQGGRIYSSATTGTHALSGAILKSWIAQGAENSSLGYPTGDLTCGLANGGCKQAFQGGTVWSLAAAGTFPVTAPVVTAWQAAGGESGVLGYPITGLICGLKSSGCGQVFQSGRVYTTATTGTHALSGAILKSWIAQGAENSSLGYPTGDLTCGLANGGCKQAFQGGTVWSLAAAGTFPVVDPFLTVWQAAGGEGGPLGYPTTGVICGLKSNGCGQVFQGGRVYTTAGTGTHALSGAIQSSWIAQGAEGGTLGYPTSDPYAVAGGTAQNFQGGTLTLTTSTGVVTRS